jgi:UDP-N-acetylglucosamine 2-epimerase
VFLGSLILILTDLGYRKKPFPGKPALVMRKHTERPEAVRRGSEARRYRPGKIVGEVTVAA